MHRRIGLCLLLLTIAAIGCKRRAGALPTDAAPPPSFSRSSADAAHIELDDLWRRALQGDPIDLARLADREGATALLEAIQQGGDVGIAALHALPHADDAELAMQRLGEIALQTDGDRQLDVVDAIEQIALRPAPLNDPIDPPGVRACADALLEIARKGSVRGETRAVAVSTLRLLAERFAVDPAAIPADLDGR